MTWRLDLIRSVTITLIVRKLRTSLLFTSCPCENFTKWKMKNEDSLWLFKSYQKNSFHLDEFDTNKILTLKVELDGPGADNNEDRDGFDQFWHSFKCCSGSKMIGSGCGIIGDIYWVSLFLMYRILHNIYQVF